MSERDALLRKTTHGPLSYPEISHSGVWCTCGEDCECALDRQQVTGEEDTDYTLFTCPACEKEWRIVKAENVLSDEDRAELKLALECLDFAHERLIQSDGLGWPVDDWSRLRAIGEGGEK